MKILIVSDTHNAVFDSVISALCREKDVDVIIHCGDFYDDVLKICEAMGVSRYYRVPGNCDRLPADIDRTIMLELEGKKIMITHGHQHGVKFGLEQLKAEAEKRGADIVLFGHTHVAWEEEDNGILYLNPGSTILPNDGDTAYAVMEITEGNVNWKIIKF